MVDSRIFFIFLINNVYFFIKTQKNIKGPQLGNNRKNTIFTYGVCAFHSLIMRIYVGWWVCRTAVGDSAVPRAREHDRQQIPTKKFTSDATKFPFRVTKPIWRDTNNICQFSLSSCPCRKRGRFCGLWFWVSCSAFGCQRTAGLAVTQFRCLISKTLKVRDSIFQRLRYQRLGHNLRAARQLLASLLHTRNWNPPYMRMELRPSEWGAGQLSDCFEMQRLLVSPTNIGKLRYIPRSQRNPHWNLIQSGNHTIT